MTLLARLEFAAPDGDRRSTPRRRSNTLATLRQRNQPNETIHIVDLSPEGCGFRSRRPLWAGERVWLALPGLETWPATISWFKDGRGGLRFDRPFHPSVAERYMSDSDRG